MDHSSFHFPLPPHALVRPSLLAVGPFHQGSGVVRKLERFFPFYLQLQKRLPSLTLFLIGRGSHHCFSGSEIPRLHLVEFERVPCEYIFYGNLLLDFSGKESLQVASLKYAQKIGCPTIQPFSSGKLSFFLSTRKATTKNVEDLILSTLHSPSSFLDHRFEQPGVKDSPYETA